MVDRDVIPFQPDKNSIAWRVLYGDELGGWFTTLHNTRVVKRQELILKLRLDTRLEPLDPWWDKPAPRRSEPFKRITRVVQLVAAEIAANLVRERIKNFPKRDGSRDVANALYWLQQAVDLHGPRIKRDRARDFVSRYENLCRQVGMIVCGDSEVGAWVAVPEPRELESHFAELQVADGVENLGTLVLDLAREWKETDEIIRQLKE